VTDVGNLDILIRAQNLTGAGILAAERNIAGLEATANRASAATAVTASRARSRVQQLGLGMQNFGRAMTQYVSLPLAGIGVATAYVAYKFSDAMYKIQTLVGISAGRVAEFRKEVLLLAPAVGKSPQELAEALYYITSSGFKGAAALRVLNASAKASAAGLGQTATVADAVTSAINAYGESNLSATRATSILLAAVREGKAEPEEFAHSIGRVIAPAQLLGVTFDQVSAAVASLSLTGLDASEATTAVRGTLMELMKPAKQSRDELDKLGLSFAELRAIVRDRGLLPALEMLRQATKGDDEAMARIFPNVRALNGVLALTGENAGKNEKIFRALAGATTDAAEAFAKVKTSDAFKLRQEWARLQAEAIPVGMQMLPVFREMLSVVGDIARAFNAMPKSLQKVAIAAGLVSVALGPVTAGLGGLIRGGSMITQMLRGAGAARTAASTGAAAGGESALMSYLTGGAAGGAAGAAGFGALGTAAAVAGPIALAAGTIYVMYKLTPKPPGREMGDLKPKVISMYNAALKRHGMEEVTIDGKVYYEFKVVPKPEKKGGEAFAAAFKKWAESTPWRAEYKPSKAEIVDYSALINRPLEDAITKLARQRSRLQDQLALLSMTIAGTGSKAGRGKKADLADALRDQIGDINKAIDTYNSQRKMLKPPKIDIGPVKESAKNAKSAITDLPNFFSTKAAAIKTRWLTPLGAMPAQSGAKAQATATAVKTPLQPLPGFGSSIGSNFAWSFANGVGDSGALQAAAANAAALAAAAERAARAELKNGPPSRVGIDIGKTFATGIGIGIRSGTDAARRAALGVAEQVAGAGGRLALAGSGSSRGAKTVNVYVRGSVVGLDDVGRALGGRISDWQDEREAFRNRGEV
jgi:TP901 family phage tail tape measure protein